MSEPAPEPAADPIARILVVDDDEDNRDMLSQRLIGKGYESPTAEDGAAALERIARGDIDLVLLDVMMPGMSGVDCLKRIREDHAKMSLPVIMATPKTDSQNVVVALSGGANDYVTKPIDFPVLLARVESHLSMRREANVAATAVTVPRPQVMTNPESPAAPEEEVETPSQLKPSDTKARNRSAHVEKNSAAPEQPPMWMWLGLVAVLAALGWAAMALGL